MHGLARLIVIAVLAVAVLTREATAADPVDVFVDGRDPAFLVVQGVAVSTDARARREMIGYAALENVSMIAWSTFRQNAESIIEPHIIKNEYPQSSTLLGVIALVKAYPGRSFAITWNGGLAVSFQDYQYAVRTYKAYQADAKAYEDRRANLQTDPVNPQHHLAALLNR